MNVADTLKQQAVATATSPSTWLAVVAGIGAVAQYLTATGEPHLVMVGGIVAAVFKVAEMTHDAYVKGKKLDVERQYVTATAQATPSLIAGAQAVGLPVGYTPPTPSLDGTAPAVNTPQPDPNAPAHALGQAALPTGVMRS